MKMAKTRLPQIQPGDKLGRWLVLEAPKKDRKGRWRVLCRCSCEKQAERNVDCASLLKGTSTSCGCYSTELVKDRALDIAPGTTFSRWTVLEEGPRTGHNKRTCLCECSCEARTVRTVLYEDLKHEKSVSCGCVRAEMLVVRNTTHGLSKSEEHRKKRYKEYIAARREQVAFKQKEYREANKEKLAEARKGRYAKDPDRGREYAARRRARKLQATPPWDQEKTKQVFLELSKKAKELYEQTGVEFQVDHILPLRGRKVCGLHVWNNFQLLEKSTNISKGNKFNA